MAIIHPPFSEPGRTPVTTATGLQSGRLGKRWGLLGCTADALAENHAMLHVFEKAGFRIVERSPDGMNTLKLDF